MKRVLSVLLALLMLFGSLGTYAAAVYENIYTLTVVGVAEFGGGDVEAGTDLSLVLPANPKKSGFQFAGWVVTNGAGEVIDQPALMPEYDVTFTAQWTAGPVYTITFLTEEGEIIESRDYTQGAAVEAPDYAVPVGMRIRGWRNVQTGRIEQLPEVMPARDLEYLAVLEEIYYTVTFMDGTAEVGEVTVGYGEPAQLIDRIPQSGKVFRGWCLNPDATEPDYLAGDLLDLEADLTLYALWADAAPIITLRYPTLTFEDVITMNIYFDVQQPENVTQMGLITYRTQVSDYGLDNAETVIPGYSYSEAKGLYCVTSNGIPAKELGDTIWLAVYAQLSDGSCIYTNLVSYSPKSYAYDQLKNGDASVRPLMVAMLNYGAAAQTFFNHHTDILANADLDETQLSLIEGYRADMVQPVATPDAAKAGAFLNNGGYTSRYPSISFEGAFAINYYCIPAHQPVGEITMYLWDQSAYDAAQTLTAQNATQVITMTPETDRYGATVEGIAAKDLDRGIYVSFCYSDGTTDYCSGILAYSIGAYCTYQSASGGAVAPLAEATAVYGYYAKEYFYK